MPKRTNIKSVLIIGAGPIVIGQGCEFDYSGVQACKALKAEGYRTILVNSNPATIMTDPEICDSTYIEPIHWESIEKIIEKEKPDALLPTMGGQTALNCALELVRQGILEKYAVELIGASETAINKAEDREQFRAAMQKIELEVPKAKIANSLETAIAAQRSVGFPTVIRPSFTLGGSGGGIAYTLSEFEAICKRGLALSPTNELLIEESLLGWKEFELEVIRDKKDNCIIVCTIENIDPMGIHTGDSITVAPAQTLTDKEYQRMRNAAIAILREVGVETGGANVQFAVHPKTGRMVVIEMNPRVSRSSALASKATGFPIAKIAAKLAIGYTLDELQNDITQGQLPASFEPTIDYVVTKIPRFNFEKFETANTRLTTQMKSVGEVMAIGRTFQESLQKALCSLENGFDGLTSLTTDNLPTELEMAGPYRINFVAEAFRKGFSLETIAQITQIDPWFLNQIEDLVTQECALSQKTLKDLTKQTLFLLKRKGFSDRRIATLLKTEEQEIRLLRHKFNIHPVFKRVDSCAAEFPTNTAYLYSTYETVCEANPSTQPKIMVLGSGPNRIGQGIEFDYCCVHAILGLKEIGYETIMVNCNPETVSTDYDISDRLYFEPLTLEHVLEIIAIEKPTGVIVQYGGQTPLKLTRALQNAGVPLIGTTPDSIDCAEDRQRFSQLLQKLNLKQPEHGIAFTVEEGQQIAKTLGYPIVVRPSYVLGGRAMKIVHNAEELSHYLTHAVILSEKSPILLDRFLDNAIEVDIDAVADGEDVFIGGILEHIEYAGIHSGDSACSLPPFRLNAAIQVELRQQTITITKALSIIGPINIQFAIQADNIFVIEANPRASRTVPFVAKATGIPLAKIGARCMVNQTLKNQNVIENPKPDHFSIKLPVFSFNKFPGVDPVLGPEMKSTGEVMGVGKSIQEAFAKSTIGIWPKPKLNGCAYIYTDSRDIAEVIKFSQELFNLGFKICANSETAHYLQSAGLAIETIELDQLQTKQIALAIVLTEDHTIIESAAPLRIRCVENNINYITTLQGSMALITHLRYNKPYTVYRLQELWPIY